jgi:hypothetical protein
MIGAGHYNVCSALIPQPSDSILCIKTNHDEIEEDDYKNMYDLKVFRSSFLFNFNQSHFRHLVIVIIITPVQVLHISH